MVSVFARGLLKRVITRIYFPDEEKANGHRPSSLVRPQQQGGGTQEAAGQTTDQAGQAVQAAH